MVRGMQALGFKTVSLNDKERMFMIVMGWSKDLAAKPRALANDLDKPRTPGPREAKVEIDGTGETYALGVSARAVKSFDDGSAADRKRAETIEEDGRETGTSVAEYLESTQAGVKGMTKGFPIVGRWTSPDGTLFYVAVGGILSPSPAE
jgi:hypothetical protein